MDYKEKYEKGLKCIQEILCGAGDLIKISILRKRLQSFFPELDEKSEKEQQHNDSEEFYCEFRDCNVTYRKTCKNCIVAGADEDGNFYCPYYKK